MPKIPTKTVLTSDHKTNGHEERRAYALHKEEAVIHTASIDVKIIRLNKRQVTQSVFRQLRERSIFQDENWHDEDLPYKVGLSGEPWGVVDYTWDKARPWAERYLVWQEGQLLYRMPVVTEKGLRSCIDGDPEEIWGCPSCDYNLWGRRRNGNGRLLKCSSCRRKCRYFKVSDPVSRAEMFFSYFDRWELWDAVNGRSKDEPPVDPRDTEEYGRYLTYIRIFDALDQLFIAV